MPLIHVADAAAATVAAVERGAPGVYNVVDDESATAAEVSPASRRRSARSRRAAFRDGSPGSPPERRR